MFFGAHTLPQIVRLRFQVNGQMAFDMHQVHLQQPAAPEVTGSQFKIIEEESYRAY